MKKNFIICLAVTLLAACEGPMGPAGRDGMDGLDGLTSEWYNILLDVTEWQLSGEKNQIGSYYYCLFTDIGALDEAMYQEGLVLCYYEYTDKYGDLVMTPLPHTVYDIAVNEGVDHPYAIHFSYDVTPGSILLKLTYSDFLTEWTPPHPCRFKLVLVY